MILGARLICFEPSFLIHLVNSATEDIFNGSNSGNEAVTSVTQPEVYCAPEKAAPYCHRTGISGKSVQLTTNRVKKRDPSETACHVAL